MPPSTLLIITLSNNLCYRGFKRGHIDRLEEWGRDLPGELSIGHLYTLLISTKKGQVGTG